MSGWLTCRYCPLIDSTMMIMFFFWLLDLFSNDHINGNHVFENMMIFVVLWKCRKFRQVICPRFFSHRVRHTLIDWFCKATEERKFKEVFFFFSRIIPNIIWKKIILNFRYILNVFNLVYNFAAIFRPFSILYLECYFSLPAKTTLTALFSIRMSNNLRFDIEKFRIHLFSSNTWTKRMGA